MTTIQFLAEWAIRSSILILSGALALWALRVKDPSIRLAAWTALLCGSLAIPALTIALPKAPIAVMRVAPRPVETPLAIPETTPAPAIPRPAGDLAHISKPLDWARAALSTYLLVALVLLLRLGFGLAMSLRLLRHSHATGHSTEGIEIRESDRVATPVTLGIARPAIVLPIDWREWDGAKLDAVLAHERSHVRRRDPAVQLLSAIHRVLLWHSPLSWFLHRRIVRVAEEASDDAAVAVTRDRALYAEVLLGFMQRAVRGAGWQGVPMARYGRADQRIHRILDGTALSRGVTRRSIAAILALVAPLAYVVAAVQAASPQRQASAAPAHAIAVNPGIPNPGETNVAALPRVTLVAAQMVPKPTPAAKPTPASAYLRGIGNVAASSVTIKPQVDGQLKSVSFKEGGLIEAGQLLASIDSQPFEVQLIQAQAQLLRDEAQLTNATQQLQRLKVLLAQNAIPKERIDEQAAAVTQLDGILKTDQADVDSAKLKLSYAQIRSPIAGVAGLLLVDPGNIVHAADATGIVVINQLQPISVLFTIPEDVLPQVLALLRAGERPPVEAWNRTDSAKIAAGRLTAADNQIDPETGTLKLKATFDNKDGALFPNEFVNVHLLVRP